MDTIPAWSQFMVPVLQVMADGAIRPLRDVRAAGCPGRANRGPAR